MKSRRIAFFVARTSRALVRRQLNQISRDEARSNSQMSENLHQEPRRVTAGPAASFHRLLPCLDGGIHARHIVNFVSPTPIQVNEEADRTLLLSRNPP